MIKGICKMDNVESNNIDEENKKKHKRRLIILLLLLFFSIDLTITGFIIYKKDANNKLSFNVDIDNDGDPDLNLDFGTKSCKVNCSDNNLKKPFVNIDYEKDRVSRFNVDTTGDGKADSNLINQDTDDDGKCNLNCDTNDDGWPE